MTATSTFGPSKLVVYDVRAGTSVELFRIVKSPDLDDPGLIDSFRSHYELGAPPRHLESRSAAAHMGLSMYLRRSQAAGTAERFPRIGGFIARVRLDPRAGYNLAETGHPGHVTVWGRPNQLIGSVMEITAVG